MLYIILKDGGSYNDGGSYHIVNASNIQEAIYEYYKFQTSCKDTVFEKMCMQTDIFSIRELVAYCNTRLNYIEQITDIYTLGVKLY